MLSLLVLLLLHINHYPFNPNRRYRIKICGKVDKSNTTGLVEIFHFLFNEVSTFPLIFIILTDSPKSTISTYICVYIYIYIYIYTHFEFWCSYHCLQIMLPIWKWKITSTCDKVLDFNGFVVRKSVYIVIWLWVVFGVLYIMLINQIGNTMVKYTRDGQMPKYQSKAQEMVKCPNPGQRLYSWLTSLVYFILCYLTECQ